MPGWPDPGEGDGRPSGMPSPEPVAGGGWGAVTAGPGRTGGPGSRSVEGPSSSPSPRAPAVTEPRVAGATESRAAGGERRHGRRRGRLGDPGPARSPRSVIVGSGVSIGFGSLMGRGGTGLGGSITRGGGSGCGGSGAVTSSTGSTGSGREA